MRKSQDEIQNGCLPQDLIKFRLKNANVQHSDWLAFNITQQPISLKDNNR